MKLFNQTKNIPVCDNVKKAETLGEKSKGLVGSNGKTGLFMQTRVGIHTFGMSFPIDVLILDGKNRVAKYKRNMKPNRIFVWNPRYSRVVEIPTSLIQKGIIEIGDEIQLKNLLKR